MKIFRELDIVLYFSTALRSRARRCRAACSVSALLLDAASKGIEEVALLGPCCSQSVTANWMWLSLKCGRSLTKGNVAFSEIQTLSTIKCFHQVEIMNKWAKNSIRCDVYHLPVPGERRVDEAIFVTWSKIIYRNCLFLHHICLQFNILVFLCCFFSQ